MHSARRILVTMVAIAAAGAFRISAGDTLIVPGRYPTIQAAIDASVDGDVVLVADGVYTGPGNRDIDFRGKSITLRSASGPDSCVINCQGTEDDRHRGFWFHSGESEAAVLDGFTVRNGVVGGNVCSSFVGGGIRCDDSSPTIANCIITGNMVQDHCVARGGGVYSSGGSPRILNCEIIENDAFASDVFALGGGIYCAGGSPVIANCTIAGNTATTAAQPLSRGGGLYLNCNAQMINCVVDGNFSINGGGINQAGGSLTLVNCTVAANEISASAGSALVANCIIWTSLVGTNVTVTHSDVQGGWAGSGSNNIAQDPLFVDLAGADGDVGTRDDDLRLRPGSPCIDAAENAAVPAGYTVDRRGSARFVDDLDSPDCPQAPGGCGRAPVVDMGAHEYHLPCPWDLDHGAAVGTEDLQALLAAWGAAPPVPAVAVAVAALPRLHVAVVAPPWGRPTRASPGRSTSSASTARRGSRRTS